MDNKKRSVALPLEKAEELSDTQLSQVNGGLEMPLIPFNWNRNGLIFEQAIEMPTCFTKSDDRLPLNKDS